MAPLLLEIETVDTAGCDGSRCRWQTAGGAEPLVRTGSQALLAAGFAVVIALVAIFESCRLRADEVAGLRARLRRWRGRPRSTARQPRRPRSTARQPLREADAAAHDARQSEETEVAVEMVAL